MRTLADARVWHLAAIGFTMANGLYALSFWMPQLVRSFSRLYSNTVVGLLVMIPHLVGLVAMLLVSRDSDRNLERRYHIAIPRDSSTFVSPTEFASLFHRPSVASGSGHL